VCGVHKGVDFCSLCYHPLRTWHVLVLALRWVQLLARVPVQRPAQVHVQRLEV
jgi:hypothetical protein